METVLVQTQATSQAQPEIPEEVEWSTTVSGLGTWLQHAKRLAYYLATISIVVSLGTMIAIKVGAPAMFLQIWAPLCFLAAAPLPGLAFLRDTTERLVITKDAVRIYSGRLFQTVTHVPWASVTDVSFFTGPVGRRLGYGTTAIGTAGGDFWFNGLKDFDTWVRLARDRCQEARIALPKAKRRATDLKVLWQGRTHAIAAASGYQRTAMAAIATGYLFANADEWVGYFVAVAVAIYVIKRMVSRADDMLLTSHVITEDTLIVKTGWLTRDAVELRLDRISHVETTQTWWQRLANVDTIIVNAVGDGSSLYLFSISSKDEVLRLLGERGVETT